MYNKLHIVVDYVCQEDDVPLDLSLLQIDWRRNGPILEGDISCKSGYTSTGKSKKKVSKKNAMKLTKNN